MQYKHITKSENYEDYSSGRVLMGYSGATNFPVRLTQEIFERCTHYLEKQSNTGLYTLYDPFCGVAYTLTIIGLLYKDKIKSIYASDINEESLSFAEKNLSLLNETGLNKRIIEIESLIKEYDKESHKEALKSALQIKQIRKSVSSPKISVFKNNILKESSLSSISEKVDIVISDIPYGNLTEWSEKTEQDNQTQKFLNNIKNILSPKSIVAISSNKKQELQFNGYEKVGTFKIGKRKILFLIPQ